VLDYVRRYTHRVAISNNRLLDIENDQVRFMWKDYRNQSQQKTMTLSAEEFIRRFLLHALPDGFHRIRYYGFLGNRYPQENSPDVAGYWAWRLQSPDYRDRHEELTGTPLCECPVCHRGQMVTVELLEPADRRIEGHLMSSVVALARSWSPQVWFHQPSGKLLSFTAANLMLTCQFHRSTASQPVGIATSPVISCKTTFLHRAIPLRSRLWLIQHA